MRRVGRARNASRSDAGGAHARRKFFEAVELNPQDQSAIGIVAQMDELFAIDAQPREQAINQQDRQPLRLEKSKPLLAEIKTQIQTARSGALPKSALAKACNYTLTLWARLTRFLEYPELELSNNLAENAMRPVALGRRYEQSGIRQSLTRAKRDFRRWALDMADGTTLPIFT